MFFERERHRIVASSSVFNIGVELKGMLDVDGTKMFIRVYRYINRRYPYSQAPADNVRSFAQCLSLLKLSFFFESVPSIRVAQFPHYVMHLWMVLLPYFRKLDAILPFHWQRPVKYRGFPVKGWIRNGFDSHDS